MQVRTWTNNYRGTMWWWQWMWGSFPESYFFSQVLKAGKPTSNHVCELIYLVTATLFCNSMQNQQVNCWVVRSGSPVASPTY